MAADTPRNIFPAPDDGRLQDAEAELEPSRYASPNLFTALWQPTTATPVVPTPIPNFSDAPSADADLTPSPGRRPYNRFVPDAPELPNALTPQTAPRTGNPVYINLEDPISFEQAQSVIGQARVVISADGMDRRTGDLLRNAGIPTVMYFEGNGGGDSGWAGERAHFLENPATGPARVRDAIRHALDQGYSTIYIDNIDDTRKFPPEYLAQLMHVIVDEQQRRGLPPMLQAENSAAYVELARNPERYGLPREYWVGGIFEANSRRDLSLANDFAEAVNRGRPEQARVPVVGIGYAHVGDLPDATPYSAAEAERDMRGLRHLDGVITIPDVRHLDVNAGATFTPALRTEPPVAQNQSPLLQRQSNTDLPTPVPNAPLMV